MPDLTAIGIELALFGMGTVFSFLTLLVVATKVMSGLVARFSIEEGALMDSGTGQPSDMPSSDVIAAVSAAVHRFRKDKNR
jgi:oxaloacetate decarboxylase (Na+ extruding) subunit gamma